MLNDLGFDIGMVGVITALAVLAKVVSLPYWGRAINRFGNRPVLIATSFGASVVPLIWLLSRDPMLLGLFNAFSGFVWAGLDLASFNYALSLVGASFAPRSSQSTMPFQACSMQAARLQGAFSSRFSGMPHSSVLQAYCSCS